MKLHSIIKNKGWDTSHKRKKLSSEDHLKGVFAKNQNYYEISTIYECVEKQSMTIIWIIKLIFNDSSWMLHLSEFVWTLSSSVWVVFINFLLIDATDISKISSDQKRFFFAGSLYPLSFFANTPFKIKIWVQYITKIRHIHEIEIKDH